MTSPDPTPLADALARALPRPDVTAKREEKKNYAERLSGHLALLVADRLRRFYPRARITPRPDGSGQEFVVGTRIDRKKIDIGVWDDAAGLVLGVSIKTYSFRDYTPKSGKIGRYIKNVKRNDMELRDEADVLHRRQPFAVLFALFFLPKDAAWDGVAGQSSLAHVVFTLRKRTGRASADSPRYDLFERIFVGLYDEKGSAEFFDVSNAPRRNQPPDATITLDELIQEMIREVEYRSTGNREGEQYAPDDLAWKIPPGSLPWSLNAVTVEDLEEGEDGNEDEP